MNIYTHDIAKILNISLDEALKVQNFIEEWFDDFRFSSATDAQFKRAVREAQAMMADPIFKVGA